jgi:hypothetical protein
MFEYLLLKWIKNGWIGVTYYQWFIFVGQKLFSQDIYEQDISTGHALATKISRM